MTEPPSIAEETADSGDFLPDLCRPQAVLAVAVGGQLLAVLLALAQPFEPARFWPRLGAWSLAVQWVALLGITGLCAARPWLCRLLPDLDITIGKLSAASGQGKHTTTATTLYHLPQGGSLIDSPGVRDFHPGEVAAQELQQGFREFRPLLGECRFNDCRHLSEPGCAVLAAVAAGRISERRMASYQRLLQPS